MKPIFKALGEFVAWWAGLVVLLLILALAMNTVLFRHIVFGLDYFFGAP